MQARDSRTSPETIFDEPGLIPTKIIVDQPTPFSPLKPTPGSDAPELVEPTQQNFRLTPQPDPRYQLIPEADSDEPTLDFHGIDFSSQQRVTITVYPTGKNVNRGKPFKLSFIPGDHCRFGDKRGCVYAYKPNNLGNIIVITVHSGVGGEAQQFRAALEGTGINRAGFRLEKVNTNMENLSGAQVIITQGDRAVDQLQLAVVSRIPARFLTRYFRTPLAEILSFAAGINPQVKALVSPEIPQIVIETCGWKMPGEQGGDRVTDTTGSIYLGIIR